MRCRDALCFASLVFGCANTAAAGVKILLTGAAAEGRVEVVRGAHVRAFAARQSSSLVETQRRPIASAETGPDGRVDLDLPALPGLVLVVDAEGYAPLIAPLAHVPRSELRLALDRGEVLSSALVRPPGSPVPKGRACVLFDGQHVALPHPVTFERCSALTNEGALHVGGLVAGVAGDLEVRAEGYLPIRTRLPFSPRTNLRLDPGLLVVGNTLSARREALVGVSLLTAEGESAESGQGGRFELRASRLPLVIIAHAPGFRRTEMTLRNAEEAPQLLLEPGPTLAGTLFGPQGEPLPRALVRVDREVSPGAWRPIGGEQQQELAAGAFLLDLPAAGRYRTQIRAAALAPLDVAVFEVLGTEAVDLGALELDSGSQLVGRVVDAASGQPLPGVLVRLLPQGLAGLRRLTQGALAETVSGSDGSYRLGGQEAGAYELRFERQGYARAMREIEVTGRESRQLVDQALGKGATVTCLVRDLAGRPRTGVTVKILAPSGTSVLPLASLVSDPDGRTEAVSLAPGSYRVEVHGERPLLAQTLDLAEGEEEVEWTLALAGVAVAGRVTRQGEPVIAGSVRLAPALDPGTRLGKFVLSGPTGASQEVFGPLPVSLAAEVDAAGWFRMEDVPPGPLAATYLSPDGELSERLVEIPPQPEVVLAIELAGATVAGSVREEGGEVLPDASVSLRDGLGNLVASSVTNAAGGFELNGLEPRDGVLEVRKAGFATRVLPGVRPGAHDPIAIELVRADASSLHARLISAQGIPLSHVFVSLYSAGGSRVTSLPLDAQGERRWDELAAGGYYLVWSDPAVGVGASAPFSLDHGEAHELAVQLSAPTALTLTCAPERCAGAALERLSLRTLEGIDLAPFLPGFSIGLAFSPSGTLPLGAIEPGDYRLLARVGGISYDVPFAADAGSAFDLVLEQPAPRAALERLVSGGSVP